MTRKKTDITKENKPVVDNIAQLVVEEGKKIAKDDFAKFSAIVAVIFSAGLWVVKSIWYAYMSGRFLVYKIDKCYINTDNDNIFLQIIQLASILVVWFLINYVYYKISVAEDKSRFSWKRIIRILIFWIVEMFITFAFFLIYTHTQLWDLVCKITLGEILALSVCFFIICLLINIYAIEFLIEEWLKKRKAKKASNQESDNKVKKEKRIKNMFLPMIVTIAIELIIVFFTSYNTEYDRCGYKLIMIQCDEATESKFDIEYEKDNNTYKIYPVAYENQDCYIVTRLYNENGKIKIDYNYQMIMEKEGQETIYVDSIYDIGGDN